MSHLDNNIFVVKEVNGIFYTICERFNIVTKDKDLSIAYAELETLRNNMLERFREMGLSLPQQRNDECPSSHDKLSQKRSLSFPTGLIVIGVCLIFLTGITIPILNAINGVVRPLQDISTRLEFLSFSDPAEISKMFTKVADILKEVTPQRKEELHKNLKTIVNEMEPFVDDIRPLIFETHNSKSTE